MDITLVGETNPYGGTDQFALYPAPDGCSGHRLCCLIFGMKRKDYLETFKRANLVQGVWSIPPARQRANELMQQGGKFVLCGSKVAAAFGLKFKPFDTYNRGVILMLPHPSGLSRAWNQPDSITKARDAMIAFAPEIASLIGIEE